MRNPLNPTWDLDSIYPGGSESREFHFFLNLLEKDIAAFAEDLAGSAIPQTDEEGKRWSEKLAAAQQLDKRLNQASSFISCLTAQNVKDQHAKILNGRWNQLQASFHAAMTLLDEQIANLPQAVWENLLKEPEWAPLSFPLEERRLRAKEKLPSALERLAADLAVDGYHAWEELYNTIVGRITIPFAEDGEVKELSVGQAQNKMVSGNRAVREEIFQKWEEDWSKEEELCASALNHLAGFRIQLSKHRGWDSILKEPLDYNRMSESTLHAMWDVIERNKDIFVSFLNRKAKLLGLQRLSWHDVEAPLNRCDRRIGYEEAAEFVVEHFRRFSPKMADFAAKAFEGRWIEAEDRPGKRPGGFCTSFPLSQESRIFMTFGGTAANLSTLAHELGHAYHQHVMDDLPYMAQHYAMNVAETASTFAEMIVADAAVRNAKTTEERLSLLEDKIQRSIAFSMDIHARFLFELRFYGERKKGPVSAERLNELMTEAQREAFRGALERYHPHFWASKLHFYITEVPFYNFPYTFGYLFSSGVYARTLEEGSRFAEKYVDLLRDTGRMKVEDLAAKHLGVDLSMPDFWQSAIDLALGDVKEFLRLTEQEKQ